MAENVKDIPAIELAPDSEAVHRAFVRVQEFMKDPKEGLGGEVMPVILYAMLYAAYTMAGTMMAMPAPAFGTLATVLAHDVQDQITLEEEPAQQEKRTSH